MRAFIYMFTLLSLISTFSANAYNDQNTSKECHVTAQFIVEETITKNNYQIAENVSLFTKSYTSFQNAAKAKLATNISCQHLDGSKYNTSEEEWQNILKRNFTELSRQGFQEVKLTPLLEKNKKFKGAEQHKEYRLDAKKGNYSQVFYLVNIINDEKDTLYSVMVSGDSSITRAIKKEYRRILATLALGKSLSGTK